MGKLMATEANAKELIILVKRILIDSFTFFKKKVEQYNDNLFQIVSKKGLYLYQVEKK